MSKRDFYDVLSVSKDADEKTLKAAYRKLAMANHPDRNQGDAAAEERFREASEAYEVLKDPQKRAAYDRMGHAAFEQSAGGFGGGGGVLQQACAASSQRLVAQASSFVGCDALQHVAAGGGSLLPSMLLISSLCSAGNEELLSKC